MQLDASGLVRETDLLTGAVWSGLDELSVPLTDLYRELHQHPELSLREHRTAQRVAAALRPDTAELGVNVRTYSSQTRDLVRAGIERVVQGEATAALRDGRIDSLPGNHSPHFAPVIEPTLTTGIQALVIAALTWLGTPGIRHTGTGGALCWAISSNGKSSR